MMSSGSSSPTERRTSPSVMPAASRCGAGTEPCVIETGCVMSVSAAPRFSASEQSRTEFIRRTRAARRLLASREPGLREGFEAGVGEAHDARVPREEARDAQRVLRVARHADAERLDALEREPRVEGRLDGAGGLADEVEPLVEPGVAGDEGAADGRVVPLDELGRGVEDDVGAEVERALEGGRQERVVDDEERPGRARESRRLLDVRQLEGRVGGRLDEDDARRLAL